MPYEEKNAWAGLVVTVVAVATYLVVVGNASASRPLTEVPYQSTMLWTIGLAIAATIALTIVLSVVTGERHFDPDERDREIGRFGSRLGRGLIVVGGVAALAMSLAEWNWFWIANVLYLSFAMSSIVDDLAKIVAYHRGLPRW